LEHGRVKQVLRLRSVLPAVLLQAGHCATLLPHRSLLPAAMRLCETGVLQSVL
jgi:hypothetical protein